MSCLELELSGTARRAHVTGATVAGLVVLNSLGLLGQPRTETSRQRQSLLKALGVYFLKLPWLNLSLFLQLLLQTLHRSSDEVTWGVMHLCFVTPSSDCVVLPGESETCWGRRC